MDDLCSSFTFFFSFFLFTRVEERFVSQTWYHVASRRLMNFMTESKTLRSAALKLHKPKSLNLDVLVVLRQGNKVSDRCNINDWSSSWPFPNSPFCKQIFSFFQERKKKRFSWERNLKVFNEANRLFGW